MRERPSYNWIEEIVSLPKKCSNCWCILNDWDSVIYECSINYIICNECSKKTNAWWPKELYYTVIDNYQDDMTMVVYKDKKICDILINVNNPLLIFSSTYTTILPPLPKPFF